MATGPEGIKKLLEDIDIAEDLKTAEKEALSAGGMDLDKLNHKIRYLKALKELDLKPVAAYMTQNVAVLPPVFRPTYSLVSGDIATSEVNKAYRALGAVNKKIKDLDKIITPRRKAKMTATLYEGLKALHGLGDPITSTPYKGILDIIKGEQIKEGFFHTTLLRKAQEPAGRAAITLEPSYHMDEVGIPEEMAWKIYEPFLMKRLIASGMQPINAKTEIESKSEVARNSLEQEILVRPVILNRSPSLHKWSVMAFLPKLVQGNSIVVNPLVCKGFNADFDGDAMAVHIPVSDAAVDEAKEMFPSKHLFKHGYGTIMAMPAQSSLLGLYNMTSKSPIGKNPKLFHGYDEMQKAYQNNEIKIDQSVLLKESPVRATTLGREILERELPKDIGIPALFSAAALDEFIKRIVTRKDAPNIINKLKDLGFKYAYHSGATLGIDDFPKVDTKDYMKGTVEDVERNMPALQKETKKQLGESGSLLHPIIESGSRANWKSAMEMTAAPGFYSNVTDQPIQLKIDNSYAQGLTPGQFFASTYGARRAEISKSLMTYIPGELAKTLLATMSDVVINKEDYGDDGIEMEIDHDDIVDRFTAEAIKDGGKVLFPKDTLITDEVLQVLKKKYIKSIKVRSPLTAKNPHGIPAKSFGLHEDGNLPDVGEYIGIKVSHALSEPLTQTSLKAFHTGSGRGKTGASYWNVEKLLVQPRETKNSAILSPARGYVDQITEKDGLHEISIATEPKPGGMDGKKISLNTKLFLPPIVKKGDSVNIGQPVTEGNVDYRELKDIVGLKEMQLALAKELTKTYAALDMPIKQRYVEAVVRKLTDSARVLDPAKSSYSSGDWLSSYEIEDYNRENPDNPVKYEVVPSGIKTRVSREEDWPKRLVFGQKIMKNTITEGASKKWTSDIRGNSPWTSWIIGEMGVEDKPGR